MQKTKSEVVGLMYTEPQRDLNSTEERKRKQREMYCTILFMGSRLSLNTHRCTNTIGFIRRHISKNIN